MFTDDEDIIKKIEENDWVNDFTFIPNKEEVFNLNLENNNSQRPGTSSKIE